MRHVILLAAVLGACGSEAKPVKPAEPAIVTPEGYTVERFLVKAGELSEISVPEGTKQFKILPSVDHTAFTVIYSGVALSYAPDEKMAWEPYIGHVLGLGNEATDDIWFTVFSLKELP